MLFHTRYRHGRHSATATGWRFAVPVGLVAVLGLIAMMAVTAQAGGRPVPIVVGGGFDSAQIAGHLEYLIDRGSRRGIEDVVKAEGAATFTPANGNLSLGYLSDAVWVRFAINNGGSLQTLFLDLRPVFLDEVTVFAPVARPLPGAPAYRQIRLGDHIPMRERETLGVSLVAALDLPVGDSMVYVRIKTMSSVALRGSLRAPSSMIGSDIVQAIRFGVFEGIYLLIGMANFLIWLSLRERVFLSYSFALLIQAAILLGNNNLMPPGLVPFAGADITLSLLVCISHGLGAWFVNDLLDAGRKFPVMHKCFVALGAGAGMATVATMAGYYQWIIGALLASGILTFLLGVVGNAILSGRGVPGARVACLALVAILVGSLAVTGRLLGFIPFNAWTDYAFEIALIIFIVHMQIALAHRARRAENERHEAQRLALDTARMAEQNANRLVEIRTQELESAKDLAEMALQAEREAQAEHVRFVDVISHQYRTPLSVVSNSVAAIAQSLADEDGANQARIQRIRRAIDRLVDLIDVNLHRSRLEGVTAKADFREVALGNFLRDAVARMGDICGDDRPITLSISPELEHYRVRLDQAMLGLALINLVENAHKFSPPGKSVDLAAEVLNGAIAIHVRDRGIGIPDDERDKLTQKYFRASNSANTSGMGLGLNMVAKIIKTHGGTISFASRPGGGIAVSLFLPSAGHHFS